VEWQSSGCARSRLARVLGVATVFWTLAITAPVTQAELDISSAEPSDKSLDENRVVCRRLPVTGTHFKRKICKTAATWQAEAEAAREFMQSLERGQDVEQIRAARQDRP
jgi:hypothetical protein